MAILDFLNKKKEESPTPVETFTPKAAPARGPGGKFVSQKKAVIKKEIDESKVEGPFLAPFAGKEIKKYYANKKWYFAIEELIFLLSSDPPLKPLDQLKNDPKFKDLFEKEIRTIDGADYADGDGSIEILRKIIKTHNANFPGSLFWWLEDISTHKLEKIEDEGEKQN